ncbi:Sulfite reductase [NADPH] hemoprotein beta-component [Raoultella terrigena]|uniref:Sulfite reductase [NADPH] hemoprotein beta-component n=1 Tax=Raoultella terrigena TaxID=577 RepID=A0A3P8K8N0_RAOTE|nr:Sulfite reductase [NADPH] hemoprotein beta-component [Raoultella terrigena]
MYRENITESEILDSIDELVGRWAKEREAGEGFGDFTVRAVSCAPVSIQPVISGNKRLYPRLTIPSPLTGRG